MKNPFLGWHQIDLHSHTLNNRSYDRSLIESKYTHQKFFDYVRDQNVSLKAVTNHNSLILVDHIKHAIICDLLNVTYIPGIEYDLVFNTKRFHSVVLLSPRTDIILYSSNLNKFVKNRIDNTSLDIYFTIKDFADIHSNMEFILIPHAIKSEGILLERKAEDCDKDDARWVLDTIRNGLSMPFLLENTKDIHKYSVISKLEEIANDENIEVKVGCVVNSDYTFDDNIDRQADIAAKPKYFMFSKPTYRGLELAIRNYETRIASEDERIQRIDYIETINFTKSQPKCISKNLKPIKLSTALNVIIGNSGTGKTLLLNEVFRSYTGKNLTINTNNKLKEGESIYESKLENKKIVDVIQSGDKRLVLIEIPKIYNQILKYGQSQNIEEDFGISDLSNATQIILEYVSQLSEYEQQLTKQKTYDKMAVSSLGSISDSILFIERNKKPTDLPLTSKAYRNPTKTELEKLGKRISTAIETKDKTVLYLSGLLDLSNNDDYKTNVMAMLGLFTQIINQLLVEQESIQTKLIPHKIDEKIHEHVSKAVIGFIGKLGDREKSVKEKEMNKETQDTSLAQAIKDSLLCEYVMNNIKCDYPLGRLERSIVSTNQNKYARLMLDVDKNDLSSCEAVNSPIIDNTNIKQKLAGIKIDFTSSNNVKETIQGLIEKEIYLSGIIKRTPSLRVEIKDDNEWRSVTEINPGSLAKVFMEYYFEQEVNNNHPDVIFIDQPENDVDKTFITETLSKFIKNRKKTTQFIITTHDPILAVNSDVNQVIYATLDKSNVISYDSFALEDIDDTAKTYKGTDLIARILDGGRSNVKHRYQVYGGNIHE